MLELPSCLELSNQIRMQIFTESILECTLRRRNVAYDRTQLTTCAWTEVEPTARLLTLDRAVERKMIASGTTTSPNIGAGVFVAGQVKHNNQRGSIGMNRGALKVRGTKGVLQALTF